MNWFKKKKTVSIEDYNRAMAGWNCNVELHLEEMLAHEQTQTALNAMRNIAEDRLIKLSGIKTENMELRAKLKAFEKPTEPYQDSPVRWGDSEGEPDPLAEELRKAGKL